MNEKKSDPYIYAYKLYVPDRFSYIKIGYTDSNLQAAIFDESAWANLTPDILLLEPAKRPDGSILTDLEIHRILRKAGYKELASGKDHVGWFACEKSLIYAVYLFLYDRQRFIRLKEKSLRKKLEVAPPGRQEDLKKELDFLLKYKTRFSSQIAD